MRGFHLKVTANITNSSVQFLQFFQQSSAFAARLRFIERFCPSFLCKLQPRGSVQGHFSLIASNLFFELFDLARIEIEKLTVARSHRMNHAQINADIKFLWIRHLNVKFRREDHEPMTAILLDVNLPDRAGLHGTVGAFECKRTAFAVAHPTDLGQLHAAVSIIDMFRLELRNAKAVSDIFGFEFRPFFTSRIALRTQTVSNGPIEVLERLLQRLGHRLSEKNSLFLVLPFDKLEA